MSITNPCRMLLSIWEFRSDLQGRGTILRCRVLLKQVSKDATLDKYIYMCVRIFVLLLVLSSSMIFSISTGTFWLAFKHASFTVVQKMFVVAEYRVRLVPHYSPSSLCYIHRLMPSCSARSHIFLSASLSQLIVIRHFLSALLTKSNKNWWVPSFLIVVSNSLPNSWIISTGSSAYQTYHNI